jgi:putative membrane protein insertion efficiency factor
MKIFLIFFVRLYQILISPFISYNACRFHPSCSEYMVQALEKKGVIKGLCSGIWRLLRCHPWSAGGNDPVK